MKKITWGMIVGVSAVACLAMYGAATSQPVVVGGIIPSTGAVGQVVTGVAQLTGDPSVGRLVYSASTGIGVGTSAPPVLSACGTGTPTASVGSTSLHGDFTTGTGTPTGCTITFDTTAGKVFAAFAHCTIFPANAAAVGKVASTIIATQSKTDFSITWTTGADSLKFNYVCAGH
jgi:hypothetical protein